MTKRTNQSACSIITVFEEKIKMKKAILVSFAVILGTAMALQAEFQVNTYISDNQEHPAIAMDTAGNFVVVWQSKGQDGSGDGVYGRRFDAAGTALGSEFQINTTIAGYQDDPDVDMEKDVIESITFSGDTEGQLQFDYLQGIDDIGSKFAEPRRSRYGVVGKDSKGMLWLTDLASN